MVIPKGFRPHWHHLDSTWIVRTEKTPVQVRDIDSDDELLVVELTGNGPGPASARGGASG